MSLMVAINRCKAFINVRVNADFDWDEPQGTIEVYAAFTEIQRVYGMLKKMGSFGLRMLS